METPSTNSPGPMPAVPGAPVTPAPVSAAPIQPQSVAAVPSSQSTDNLVLDDTHRQQLDGIVNQMVQNKEPDHAIQFVVSDFKTKYGTPGAPQAAAPTASTSYNPLTPEGLTNLGNTLGKVFPGASLGKAVGSSAFSIAQLLAGAYHTVIGAHDQATTNFNNAFNGAASGSDINKAFADAVQTGLAVAPGGNEGSLLAKGAQGAATGYGFDVTQNLKNSNNGDVIDNPSALKPGLGTAIGGALPFASALVGNLAKHVTGFTSGTGSEVIQRAIDNPDAVGAAVKEYATTPELKQSLVSRAQAAISDFLSGNQQEYKTALDGLETKAPLQPNVASQSFADGVSKFGGSINDEGALTFKNTALSPQDQKDLQTAYSTISNWSDSSVKGMDNLRQAVGNLMDDFKLQGNARANLILSGVNNDLISHIDQSTPGYQEMLNSYGQKSQTANSVIRELNLGGNARDTTQLNNIMRLFQKDPSVMDKVSEIMGPEKAEAFVNELSGAILSDWIPAGRMGNYIRSLAEVGGAASVGASAGLVPAAATAAGGAAVSSPRVVGTAARAIGRAAQAGFGPVLRKVASYVGSKLNK